MHTISYDLELLSDATPGTGLGGDSVDDYVAKRDGKPIIAASHIKGLMRQELSERLAVLKWTEETKEKFLRSCLGAPGSEGDAGVESAARFSDARWTEDRERPTPVRRISRTAIDGNTGGAKDGSLRTVEAVGAGSRFRGSVSMTCSPDAPAAKAVRMALLSLSAVGGSRNRGSGRCVVKVENCSDSPGKLLKELAGLNNPLESAGPKRASAALGELDRTPVFFRLQFRAESPVCCPELPVRHNIIRSGFAIPASSLQGALLHHLNASDPAMADALFASKSFRAWPLLPCGEPHLTATRVSLTHRASKIAGDDPAAPNPGWFQDEAFEPYNWKEVPESAPLKAADGVLLTDENDVLLWKSAAMPRWVSAHGVHNDKETEDGRNLYSIEAMAVEWYSGLLSLPAFAAGRFAEKLHLSLGKSRSVRGPGVLTLERIEAPFVAGKPTEKGQFNLVLQSPVRLSDACADGGSLNEEFRKLAQDWAKKNELGDVDAVWGVHGIRFGWNRHGETGGRTRARRVVLPGGVVRLAARPDPVKLGQALLKGLGEGREEGFGALVPHPGIAGKLYRGMTPQIIAMESEARKDAVELALKCYANGKRALPSASQIRALMAKHSMGKNGEAAEYLKRQLESRGNRIWSTWRPIRDDALKLLALPDRDAALTGLEMLANLALSKKS